MIIFVGDKPSPKMTPGAKAFRGAACEKRLTEWIKRLLPHVSQEYLIINQCDYEYNTLCRYYMYSVYFIALGNNASKALKDVPHFKLPHPSGRNRQINDKAFVAKRLKECREWLKN